MCLEEGWLKFQIKVSVYRLVSYRHLSKEGIRMKNQMTLSSSFQGGLKGNVPSS